MVGPSSTQGATAICRCHPLTSGAISVRQLLNGRMPLKQGHFTDLLKVLAIGRSSRIREYEGERASSRAPRLR